MNEQQQPPAQTTLEPAATQQSTFTPFDQNVIQRNYTVPPVSASTDPIPEQGQGVAPGIAANTSGTTPAGNKPTGGFNPQMDELPNSDKAKAADAMVDAVLDGYARLMKFGTNLIRLDKGEYPKAVNRGEINPLMQVRLGTGDFLTVDEYVNEQSEQVADVLKVDQEFEEKVRPPMKRLFMARGIGMTDEQLLMYHFGTDLASKGLIIYEFRRQNADMISYLKEIASGNNAIVGVEQQPAAQPAAAATQPVQPPVSDYLDNAEQQHGNSTHKADPPANDTAKGKTTSPKADSAVTNTAKGKTNTPKKERKAPPVRFTDGPGDNLPNFGNKGILDKMEEISKKGPAGVLKNQQSPKAAAKKPATKSPSNKSSRKK